MSREKPSVFTIRSGGRLLLASAIAVPLAIVVFLTLECASATGWQYCWVLDGIMIMALLPSSLVSVVFCMLLAKEALSRGVFRWWQFVLIGAFIWFTYSVVTAVYVALLTDGAWDTFFTVLPYLLLNDWLRGALAGLTVWLIGVVGNVQPAEGNQSESV